MSVRTHRYPAIAAFWHWLSAALIITQFTTGYLFHKVYERGTAERADMFDWHKTIGATILIVAVLRILTRLLKPAPELPHAMPDLQRYLAYASHALIYAFLVIVPMTGLIAISSRDTVELLGGITLPALPGVSEATSDGAGELHEQIVWWFAALLVVHLLAGLYHQRSGDPAKGRLWPFRA